MTNDTPASVTRRRARPAVYLFVLLAIAGGIAIGVRWHAPIEQRLGLSASGGPAADGPSPSPVAKQLWTCGMHPQVIQDHPGDCPICHMKLVPLDPGVGASGMAANDDSGSAPGAPPKPRKIKYWWDPMLDPPYISDKPGESPMGMDLIPVYEDEAPAAPGGTGVPAGVGSPGGIPARRDPARGGNEIVIDPAIIQNMGVRTVAVTEGPLARSIRAVGFLTEAEPLIRDINLRVSGWVQRLYANTEGQHIEAGDPLFDLYSPELQVAVEELINARRAGAPGSGEAERADSMAASLYDAAVRKLELVGLPDAQIQALASLERAPDTITFVSPVTGHITDKAVVEGAAVKSGDRVLRIVNHSTLWIDAQVFEKDLPFVKVGQQAAATITSQPGEPIHGEVIFIHPHVDPMTRTAMVRLAVPNPSLTLRPGMYATVRLQAEIADRAITVPREAVIDTGESQIAFVSLEGGRFEPRRVTMGAAADDGMVQVLAGLAPGETVVVSGQFLLDSESRLREAVRKFLSERQQ